MSRHSAPEPNPPVDRPVTLSNFAGVMAVCALGGVIGGIGFGFLLFGGEDDTRPVRTASSTPVTTTVAEPTEIPPSPEDVRDDVFGQATSDFLPYTLTDTNAVWIAVYTCSELNNGATTADINASIEDGSLGYEFPEEAAWEFTELSSRTYCPQYIGEFP